MQLIYAIPFVFLSLVLCAIFLAVPSWRPFASCALVGPVAFGACSIAGWIAFALIGYSLHLRSSLGYLLAVEGLLFYALPGVLGAWFATRCVRLFERKFLYKQSARDLTVRFIVSVIAAGVGFIVGLEVAEQVLPPNSMYPAFVAAFVSAGGFAVLTFFVIMIGQRRVT